MNIVKKALRIFLINLSALYLLALTIPAVSYENDIKVLFLSVGVLTLAHIFVKPLIKIVMLPINILTMGVFSWISGVFVLYLTMYLVPQFSISAFQFAGFSYSGFVIPQFYFSTILSIALISFLLSIFSNIIIWICE